jgi:hypothetical protein
MQDFLSALNWFVAGAAVGYCWHPIWEIAKKIFTEALKARQEWKQ